MWWYLIPGAIGLAALVAAGLIVKRAFPRLVVIDVSTIARERDAERKRQIVAERAERLRAELVQRARVWLRPRLKAFGEWFKRTYRHAVELEKKYRHLGSAAPEGSVQETARKLVEEGAAFTKLGRSREAEQKFIEAVSVFPKCVKAYEELGRLYVRERQWSEAAEAFNFILKLDPRDASAHANMGELAMAQGLPIEAVARFSRAAELKPGNPQLQSLLLDALVAAKDKERAVKVYARLKELAPQFPRIADFEERIRTM
jgi:tetratricopeptide (TPR) repeat protein